MNLIGMEGILKGYEAQCNTK